MGSTNWRESNSAMVTADVLDTATLLSCWLVLPNANVLRHCACILERNNVNGVDASKSSPPKW